VVTVFFFLSRKEWYHVVRHIEGQVYNERLTWLRVWMCGQRVFFLLLNHFLLESDITYYKMFNTLFREYREPPSVKCFLGSRLDTAMLSYHG
jgi:hypothetical protein